MRNLTIQRTKSFVACLVKVDIYIEDHMSYDTYINNIPCRKLGELKNGEVKTFSVLEDAAKVFVIIDQLSKNYCNEYYNLPAGQEDIFLIGKNRFNPASGNAFRFDGIADRDIQDNRKKGSKKGLIVLLIACIIGIAIGVLVNLYLITRTVKPKDYSADGMSITLTNQFKEVDSDVFVACYETPAVSVMTMKEEFELEEGFGNLTLEEYGEGLIMYNEQSARSELMEDGDLLYFIYDDIFDHKYYTWVTYVYKSDDAFWYVDFVTLKEDAEAYREAISEWARTVRFTDEA